MASKSRGKKGGGKFLALPAIVTNCQQFYGLSGSAAKLLIQIGEQFNGNNNGDLQASFNILRHKGWRSKDTLNRAKKELINAGFIEETRQGGFCQPARCSLYALCWHPIHECRGKLDVYPTKTPSLKWRSKK